MTDYCTCIALVIVFKHSGFCLKNNKKEAAIVCFIIYRNNKSIKFISKFCRITFANKNVPSNLTYSYFNSVQESKKLILKFRDAYRIPQLK